jgi:hypothetical protein
MATKKPIKPDAKPTPAKTSPRKLENLAARPSFDETLDEQLVDNSGVFRVTTAIAREQIGHDDDNAPRFANDSLVMRAQRDGFRDDAVTLDEPVDSEVVIEDEAAAAAKRQRLATLAALAQKKRR